ncbi:MAG: hypothetical protein WEB67_11365 [Acidimicrobiia bacterium]
MSETGSHDAFTPRFPEYVFQDRVDDVGLLLPIARKRVRQRYAYSAFQAGPPFGDGRLVGGEKLLIVTYPKQDMTVLEAIKQALLEEGAASVDHVFLTDLGVEEHDYTAADGWREVPDRLAPMVSDGVTFNFEAHCLRQYLDDQPQLTGYYAGEAGAKLHWQRAAGGAMRGQWLYTTYESLISRGTAFPDVLWRLIDEKTLALFGDAAAVRITDPQGTDISWEVTEEQAALWPRGANVPGHLLGSTIQAVRFARPVETFLNEAKKLMPTLNGVVAGTGNHTGYFPHIEVTIESGMITGIKGGGEYGRLWREVVDDYAEAQYPGFPYKGWAYFNDASIGTNPKAHRNSEGLWSSNDSWTNLPERLRAGVVHFGFGAEHWDEEFLSYARDNNLPTMHFPHIHVYAPTWEIRRRSDNSWFKLIDQGWLTTLGDDDVRRVASALGGTEWLEYDWVPRIPGVNAPGDYMEDYGRDPVAVIREEVGERL